MIKWLRTSRLTIADVFPLLFGNGLAWLVYGSFTHNAYMVSVSYERGTPVIWAGYAYMVSVSYERGTPVIWAGYTYMVSVS